MASRPPPPKSVLLPLVQDARGKWGPPPAGLEIETPGPRQESVWDYPRPPKFEDVPETIRVVFGGQVLAETDAAVRVCETAGAPVYYLPKAAFADGTLVPRDAWTVCEWKGVAVYFDVVSGPATAEQAAYGYPAPSTIRCRHSRDSRTWCRLSGPIDLGRSPG